MSRLHDFSFTEELDPKAIENMATTTVTDNSTTATEAPMHDGVSDGQEMAMSVLQIASATLSLIGSCTIAYKILKSHSRTQYTPPYDRIILGLSSCDIFSSAAFILGPFLIPRSSERVWAMGTGTTCTGLGFLTQLAFGWAIWYNAVLSFYYLLTVRFQVKRDEFCRKYELGLHLSGAIFFPLTAVVGFIGGWYEIQPQTMICWVQGEGVVPYIFLGIPISITLLSLVVNNSIIYIFVRKTLLNAPKPTDLAADATSDVENNDVSTRTEEQSDEICRTRDRRLIKEVAIQGFLYVSTFLLTLTPSFVLQVMYSTGVDDQNILYPLAVLNAMLLPLQGFFNVFIYIRPTYIRFRNANGDRPMLFILKQALFDPKIPRMGSTNVGTTDNTS